MNRKELFWISVTVFMTIVAWMLLDIYKAKTVDVETKLKDIVRINFSIDPKVLKVLEKKEL